MTEVPSSHSEALQLGAVPHPGDPSKEVLFFSTWEGACKHLRDHLLTETECHAWTVVTSRYKEVIDPGDADARWRFWEQAQQTQGASAQALYEVYRSAVAEDLRDASVLGWYCEADQVTIALGTSGILVIIELALTTAFLPNQGDPDLTRQAREGNGSSRGLPRQRGMRLGRSSPAEERRSADQRQTQQRHESAWSDEERLYYRVFRPALQLIWRYQNQSHDMLGNPLEVRDYARLRQCVPPRGELDLDRWRELRRRCRQGREQTGEQRTQAGN